MPRYWTTWLVLWAVCSLAALITHVGVYWTSGEYSAFHDVLLPIARLLWLPCAPFSAALWMSGIGFHLGALVVWCVAAASGWGLIFGAFAVGSILSRKLGARAAARPAPHRGRRQFLMNAGTGIAAVSLASAGTYGAVIEPQRLQIRRYRVRIRDLPTHLDGMRIVQLSDTHLGPAVSRSFIDRAVRQAIDLKPDLFVLTGDQVESRDGHIAEHVEAFAPLASAESGAMGVLAVLGNHDWYGDGPSVRSALQKIGVLMIDNDQVYIDAARRISRAAPSDLESSIAIVGIGDLISDDTDIEAAFSGVPSSIPRIVLTHEPDTLELAAIGHERVDLALCGHTHGGQVVIPFLGAPIVPSRFGQKYVGGLVQSPVGPMIVSRGIGTSGIPIRFGVPPELVEVTLVRDGDGA